MKKFERMSSYESIDVTTFCMVFPLKSKGMTSRWPFQNDYSDSWLANVRYSPDRPPVCFEFARYGRCVNGKECKYSHHPDDVAKHNASKVLGRNGAKVLGEAAKAQGSYAKTHTDLPPKGSSHGARSILKHPPGVAGSGRKA